MVMDYDQRFLNKNVDISDLFQFDHPLKEVPSRINKIPKWFTNIPRSAPKWICTLHDSIASMGQNLNRPGNFNCCPHVLENINQNQQFIAIWHNHHEFIKPFEKEIADLIGAASDPNGYQFAPTGQFAGQGMLIVQKMKHHQILQPIAIAVAQAHKMGFIGSFNRYDEIILQLAQQAGDRLNEQHNKIFDRYEKCRNLALNTNEMGERHNAAIHGYEQGKKLIDQLMETIATPDHSWEIFNGKYFSQNAK